MYSYTPDTNELYHYGVLGMKWGVRHDRSKARAKANAKTTKLKKKVAKARAKSKDAEALLAKRRSKRAKTEIGYGLQERAFRGANKKKYKKMRAEKKLSKWEDAVKKEFSSEKLRDIDNKKAYKKMVEDYTQEAYNHYRNNPNYGGFSNQHLMRNAKRDAKIQAKVDRGNNPDKYATRKQAQRKEQADRKAYSNIYIRNAKILGRNVDKKSLKTMPLDQLSKEAMRIEEEAFWKGFAEWSVKNQSKKK